MSSESENSVGADLCALAVLLNDLKLCKDVSALQNAGNSCIRTPENSHWTYTLGKITFEADSVGGRIPCEAEEILISLSMKIQGVGIASEMVGDPLIELKCDIEIDGYRLKENLEPLYSSWHLDRHQVAEGDGITAYSHPLYHFTFGGNKMEEKGDIYGCAVILPSPRFVYPPMDAVLGIDFILQNYISRDRIAKLIQTPEYTAIVRNSQKRLWKPFYASLYSYWDSNCGKLHDSFGPNKLLPLYC